MPSIASKDADDIIMRYLQRHDSAFRNDLEELVVRAGHSPTLCTRRLERLSENDGPLRRYDIYSPLNGKNAHLYALNELTSSELEKHAQQLLKRHQLLRRADLKGSCEQYTRSLFWKARDLGAEWIRRIPQRRSVGVLDVAPHRKADLIIPLDDDFAYHNAALVECKNHRQHFTLHSDIFAKLMKTAHDAKMLPILTLAHISARAEQFCNGIGIALLHLRKQLIPKKERREARALWGKDRADRIFHAIRPDRPFAETARTPRLSMEHIATVSAAEWLSSASQRWHENRKVLPDVIDALAARDWKRLNNIYLPGSGSLN